MSDALTLAEKVFFDAIIERIIAGGPIPGSAEDPHRSVFRTIEAMKAELPALLAAYLRDLAGTPDSETMERAVEVLVCSPRLDFCSRCGDDGHQCHNCTVAGMWQDAERDLRLAYPLLVAPIRAEVERLRERERYFAGLLGVADGGRYRADWDVHLTGLLDRLATAEARVRKTRKATLEEVRDFCDTNGFPFPLKFVGEIIKLQKAP